MCTTQSEQIDQVATALAAAQAEMEPAGKNSQAPVGKDYNKAVRKYADLAAVFDVLRKVLPKNGLAVTQALLPRDDEKVHIRTTLLHTSGQWIASECIMPCDRQGGIQGLGSAISYARRYSLSALLGVVSDDDDDGQEAQGKGQGQQGNQRPPQQPRQNAPAQRRQPPQNNQGQPPQRPPSEQEQPPVQHVTLDDACFEFMTCNSVETLHATAGRMGIRKDNPQYEAILAAYNSRLEDLKGGSAPGNAAQEPPRLTAAQRTAIMAHYSKRGMAGDDQRPARLKDLSDFCRRDIASVNDLTFEEASAFLNAINENREAA